MAVKHVDLSSSNLESADYDEETGVLTITFNSGASYDYANVPQAIFSGLSAAGSPGSFFHRAIKPRFTSSQV